MIRFVDYESRELTAVTYVGTGKFNFYKDCSENAERLRQSLANYGIPLVIYDFSDLRKLVKFPSSDLFYFFTRYGAGSWFWKPIVILDALNKYRSREVIYFDSDCVVTKDPRKLVHQNLTQNDIALFRQNTTLKGWISSRAIRILRLEEQELQNSYLLTAGVILMKNTDKARSFCSAWHNEMKNPRLLLHPHFRFQNIRHRHDQSVLSALVSKGKLECTVMENGFFSSGKESLEGNIANAWVYTGEVESISVDVSLQKRIALLADYYSRKFYEITKSIIITPIHVIFFILQR